MKSWRVLLLGIPILLGVMALPLLGGASLISTYPGSTISARMSSADFWNVQGFRFPTFHTRGEPVHFAIPRLHISADFEYVGKTEKGAMDVPKNPDNVAWYNRGPRPGENGNAVIAGHLDSLTGKAVFWDLKLLKPGDVIEITDTNGEIARFAVTRTEKFSDVTPDIMKSIFNPDGTTAHLNLVTCTGPWSDSTQTYSERLVVFTDRIE